MCKEIQIYFIVKFSMAYSKHWAVKEWNMMQLTEIFSVNRHHKQQKDKTQWKQARKKEN